VRDGYGPTPRAWRRLSRRPRRRRASRHSARLGFCGALAVTALAVLDDVFGERRARERAFLKGAAPAGGLWLFVARGPGRPEGVAPVTRRAAWQ
jgi:hypothetical protein